MIFVPSSTAVEEGNMADLRVLPEPGGLYVM